MISRVKGTQDFLDLRLFNFIEQIIHQQAQRYHFKQIATPIIEHTDLFKRSLGLQTDVVSKEMFIIAQETTEDSLCLRPESTAPIMRLFLENQEVTTPWKVYSVGPMFRHERPQKGRYRQFHQATFEVINSESIVQDVQLIAMFERLFTERFGLDNFALMINFLGCWQDRQKFKKILYEYLNGIQEQLCQNCLVRKEHNIMRIFDCKVETCHALYQKAPAIADHLCDQCNQEWNQLKDLLHLLSISYSYSPLLVRGLDYYDKTVFEFVSDNLGSQKAFCGGGRYNKLATQLGSDKDFSCIGAAIGIDRIQLLLEPHIDTLAITPEPPLSVIIPMSTDQQSLALLLADELTTAGICTDMLVEDESMKAKMRKANKMGATYALILGSQEQEQRKVMVKKMITGAEELINQTELVTYLKK